MSFISFLARFGLGGLLCVRAAGAVDYDVTQPGDSGAGSLREAIAAANARPGADRVLIRTQDPITLTTTTIDIGDTVEILGMKSGEPNAITASTTIQLLTAAGDPNYPRDRHVSLRNLHLHGAFGMTGGAIGASQIQLRVENCSFSDNKTAGSGGAIHADDSLVEIVDSQFYANVADDIGGAVAAVESQVSIVRGRFIGNRADWGGSIGATGLSMRLNVVDSLIGTGEALHSGGGVMFSGERLHMQRSSVIDNIARSSDGGGLHFSGPVDGEASIIENSTFNANSALFESARGGGIHIGHGHLLLRNSTIAVNRTGPAGDAFTSGGGVFLGGSESRLDISSTIIAGNSQGMSATPRDLVRDLDPFVQPPSIVSMRRSLVQAPIDAGTLNGLGSDNLLQVDPMLEPLRYNGGLTPTMAIQIGSPACERGENAADLTSDQRGAGFARGYGAVDIGAYEYRGDTIFYGDFDEHDPAEWGCARRP